LADIEAVAELICNQLAIRPKLAMGAAGVGRLTRKLAPLIPADSNLGLMFRFSAVVVSTAASPVRLGIPKHRLKPRKNPPSGLDVPKLPFR
jgi:hypothetical protein